MERKKKERALVNLIREILTCFWDQCYNSLMVGALEKVPSVRHDFQKLEWESIGRILVYGFNQVNFFPLFLSKAFVSILFFGEESLTDSLLLDSSKSYVS